MWEGGHPQASNGALPMLSGRGKTLQYLVKSEPEEGYVKLYCNLGLYYK